MSTSLSSLLSKKDGALVTIGPDAMVFDAISRMVDRNVGSIVVTEGDAIQGIFTERDYLRRIALQGRTSRETPVRDVMTSDLITVEPSTTVDECLALMTDHKIRHLPVLEGGELLGVISIGDCVRSIAEQARDEAAHLQRFVSGSYPG